MIQVGNRRTEHINRARLKLELKRAARSSVTVILGAALALGILVYISAQLGTSLFAGTYTVRFAVTDATAVTAGVNDIRIKGVRAGTITKVAMVDGQPVISAKVEKKWGPIYRDAQAQLRPNTPLQDMYIDVVRRGSKVAGQADPKRPLDASQTDVAVRVDDVLNVFQPDVRASLHALLDNLGNGMRDRGGSLRMAFVQLTPLLRTVGRISHELARRRPMTTRLVHNLSVLSADLSRRDESLRTLVRDGAATLATLHHGRADLDATLHALPPTLSALDSSFAEVRGITGDADDAFKALLPVAAQVAPALRDVRSLNDAAAPAVRALREPIRRLVPFSQALRPLSASLDEAIGALAPQTDTINKVTKTLAGCKKGVQGFFQWDASMVKYGDVRGASPRGNFITGSPTSLRAVQSCAPGKAIGGRPAKPSDGR